MSTGQISRQGFQGNNQTYFLNTRIFRETSKETWSQKNQANHECSQAPLQRTPEWDTWKRAKDPENPNSISIPKAAPHQPKSRDSANLHRKA